MGFNTMFSSLGGEGENSDRIFTLNGVKTKFMSGKQPITFSILPALDPSNPDKRVSYLPAILPGEEPTLSDWGNGAWVYRKLGHGDWKERYDIVALDSVGEECPIKEVRRVAKQDPTWDYLLKDVGKFGAPDRVRAALPGAQQFLFCNVYLPNEPERVAHIGIFTKSVANELIGENGLVFQPSPSATEDQIRANYLAAYANGDITAPQGAPALVVEKRHDKGEASGYDVKFALDASRRVMRIPATQDIMATRYDITNLRSYLNILTPEQIVQILIREFCGRSPSGFHEYALLKLALGGKFQIPEPPSAPGAVNTVQSGFEQPAAAQAPAEAVPVPAQAVPAATPAPVPVTHTVAPQAVPVATPAAVPVTPTAVPQAVPTASPAAVPVSSSASAEAAVAMAAAVKSGAAAPVAPAPGTVPGDAVPAFDKAAFLARLAKGGQQ